MSELTFEVGRHYRTRGGSKATVLLIRKTYMMGEIEDSDCNPYTWNRGGGWHSEPVPSDVDLVAEWHDLIRVKATLWRHKTENWLLVSSCPQYSGEWQAIGHGEIVEGEGM